MLNNDREINECLEFLHIMSAQWETAKHCHSALSLLFSNIQQSAQESEGYQGPSHRAEEEPATSANKKRRLDNNPAYPNGEQEPMHPPLIPDPDPEERQEQPPINPDAQVSQPNQYITDSYDDPAAIPVADNATANNILSEADNNRFFFFSDETSSSPGQAPGPGLSGVGNFDLNMVDLFQAPATSGSLFDLFGQQFPSF